MKTLSKENLYDILTGCTILGTGGGGSLEKGLQLIDQALAQGKTFRLADFSEVPDEAMIGTPYFCGSISPETEEEKQKYAGLPRIEEHSAVRAFKAMESFLQTDFYGVLSTELGGGNTAVAFYTAAMLDKCIIDGDPAGRSVPELQHSTYFINNIPIHPLTVANEFGDVAVFSEVVDDFRAEALVRSLAVVSKNTVAVVDHPAKAKDLRNAVIKGAISYALKIGEAYRQALYNKRDISVEIANAGQGVLLFRGEVSESRFETRDGFTYGDTVIKGEGNFAGETYKIWYQNENIISWKNGEVHVTVPDLICVFDDYSGEPVTNPYAECGQKVSVIALPAPVEWTTPRGLEVFGPRSFKLGVDYQPICPQNV